MDVAKARLRRQRLVGKQLASPVDVVRHLCAVQSQDHPAAKWALALRCGADERTIDRAFDEGAFLRTHVLRPTWHYVLREDIRWLLDLTAPRVIQYMRTYDARLGVTDDVVRRAGDALRKALAGGNAMTRAECGKLLGAAGQKLGHLMGRAELAQVVCSGPMRKAQHTYALLDERASPAKKPLAREAALRELARRYLVGHAPATAEDFAWWAGCTLGDARAAFADVETSASPSRTGGVHLLPNYDELFIAYRDRDDVLPPEYVNGKAYGFGTILSRHFVVVDGRIVGGWRNVPEKRGVRVEVRTFPNVQLTAKTRTAIERCAKQYGAFVGKTASVAWR